MVASALHIQLGHHEEREFEDGEHKVRPLQNVRNEHVFVIHSLYGDSNQSVNDKFLRLLFFIGALKDASAEKVTAVIPYLCYGRKDRRTKPRDPVTTRYIARLLETAGADSILTMDVHNLQAFQNAFSIPAENLEAQKLFAAHLVPLLTAEDTVIMSPDFGGIKRADQFANTLRRSLKRDLDLVFMEKYRSGGEVWGERIVGNVNNKVVLIIDDLVSTGGTIARAAAACRQAGAHTVWALATHGIFTGNAGETLLEEALTHLITTNTIPAFRLRDSPAAQKLMVLNAAPLFAEAIRRIHEGGSIAELMEE